MYSCIHLYSSIITISVSLSSVPQNVSVIHKGPYRAPAIQRCRYVTRSQGSVSAVKMSEVTPATSVM